MASKISTSAFTFPVPKSGRLEAFNFDAVLATDIIALVLEWLKRLHHVVGGRVMLAISRQLFEF